MTYPSPKLDLKNPKYELFEPELQALNQEVSYHPDLMEILAGQAEKDVYVQLAEVASFCKVVLDGEYSKDDILKLCTLLTEKLYQRRTGIMININ